MYQSVKVSAISLKPTKWDKASNADKLEAFFVAAAKDTPQLILATEGVLEGYVVTKSNRSRQSTRKRRTDCRGKRRYEPHHQQRRNRRI